MAEIFKTDSQANALFGTTLAPGIPLAVLGDANTADLPRLIARLAKAIVAAAALEVYPDDSGPLAFGVRPGNVAAGTTIVAYAGGVGALANNAVNYVYLTQTGVLTVNQTGFPALPATPHFPLATVGAGTSGLSGISGQYSIDDITDCRARMMMRCLGV